MSQLKFTNRLINETSPYLLHHAHNPVDWYPWGAEALNRAVAENKPILLSIGYSACHWCHVMEHESFESDAIARLMNENFINIKVDREERPDLDQIYMNAVQMMTGQGGWPMTVFLTPECVPFYGGTYFPPEDRYQMPGFRRILTAMAEAYQTRPEEVVKTASALLGELRRSDLGEQSEGALDADLLDGAYQGILRNYDPVNGGFGSAPKFPPAMTLDFLLRTYHRTGSRQALEAAKQTCRKMASGGMYDQLGGGFHRYSTDAAWLVPHFEKMLYDNAQLSRLYVHMFQITKDEFYSNVAADILDYVVREMTSEQGSFYSTQDADSEGHEGRFFVWTRDEIENELGTEDALLFCSYYDITQRGNFEGKNILNVRRTPTEVAEAHKVSLDELSEALQRGRRILFDIREKRVKPGRDEKVLTAWNGLMLEGFAEAAAVFDRKDYLKVAKNNAQFLLDNLRQNGLLLRTYKDGSAKLNGYLEDYAFLASGLVKLYEVSGELKWLREARALVERMVSEFWDTENGGFFFTGKSSEELIVRSKDYFDNATPAGNSVAAEVLLRLSALTGEESYALKAVAVLRLVAKQIRRYPSAFGRILGALDFYQSTPTEVAVIGEPGKSDTESLVREVWSRYLPNKVVAQTQPDSADAAREVPLFRERGLIEARAAAYVCEGYACRLPVTNPQALAAQLDQRVPRGTPADRVD
jgi:uncharacterized protein YyaL (SSP411 family)